MTGLLRSLSLVAAVTLTTPLLAQETRLTNTELQELLIGGTEKGKYLWMGQWIDYEETFFADGSIVGNDGERYTGRWEIRGDAICTEYSGAGDGCYAYVKAGEETYTVYTLNADGSFGEVKVKGVRISPAH